MQNIAYIIIVIL